MKNILIALIGLSIVSCTDFLDENPKNFISPELLFDSEEGAEIALNGVYDILGNNATNGWGLYSANFLIIDQGTSITTSKVSESNLNQAAFAHYRHSPQHKVITQIWENSYIAIQRANMVIKRVENMNDDQISQLSKNRFIAEARFIRGLLHFNLVRLFGGISVMTEELLEVTEENVKVSRDVPKTVYESIIADFEFGTENLFYSFYSSDEPRLSQADLGRASVEAAYGMLSKVYLTLASTKKYAYSGIYDQYGPYADYSWVDETAMYQKAAENAAIVDDFGWVDLTDNYDDVFMQENTVESLFEVQIGPSVDEQAHIAVWSGTKHPDKYYLDFGYVRIGPYAGFSDSFVRNWRNDFYYDDTVYTDQVFIDSILNDTVLNKKAFYRKGIDKPNSDYRYTWNIGEFQYKHDNDKDITYRENLNNKLSYGYRKYRKTEQFEYLDNTNFRVLRFADVLLIQAEALNELGNSGAAIELINRVRERARRGSDYEYTPQDGDYPVSTEPANLDGGISQDSVFKIIKLERGWELCHEGHTRYDDLRWGQLESEVKKQVVYENNTKDTQFSLGFFTDGNNEGGNPMSELRPAAQKFESNKHWLLPIPQFELDLNSNLEQNPGW